MCIRTFARAYPFLLCKRLSILYIIGTPKKHPCTYLPRLLVSSLTVFVACPSRIQRSHRTGSDDPGEQEHASICREPSAAPSWISDWAVQGDGNALIFQEEPAVFTFSMHGEGNFPARKQNSDIDIPLPDGTSDDAYLRCKSQRLQRLSVVCLASICANPADQCVYPTCTRLDYLHHRPGKRLPACASCPIVSY